MRDLIVGRDFQPYGVAHLITLALVVILSALAIVVGRRLSPRGRFLAATGFALAWGGVELYWIFSTIGICERMRDCLPLHLCDISVFALVLGLLTRNRLAFEFAYFFGIGGTLQALLTPDLSEDFPSPLFIRFFVGHGGIIVGVALLAAAYRMRPSWRSVLRAIGMGLVYCVLIGLFNWIMDTNYGYLCRKPENPSLLDKLGPWPWYIAFAWLIIIANLLILYLPFWAYDAVRKRRPSEEFPPMST